jgi:uncharacterized protein YceH (UPF0502 family)
MMILTDVEARVFGSLLEKESTTPEYYPMTLNAVTAACNQKSSRSPVLELDDATVLRALFSLRDKSLVWEKALANSRVPKYAHRIENLLPNSTAPERAVLCVLLLRGPQTPGEIRGRTDRLHSFASPAEVESVLNGLMDRDGEVFVARLARQPGTKESRYTHLVCGAPADAPAEPVPAAPAVDRLSDLERRVQALEAAVAALQAAGPTPGPAVENA